MTCQQMRKAVQEHRNARKAYALVSLEEPRHIRIALREKMEHTKWWAKAAVSAYKKAKEETACTEQERMDAEASRSKDEAWASSRLSAGEMRALLYTEERRYTDSQKRFYSADGRSSKVRRVKATLTDAPCVASCWHAEGDVCACSCGGKNHGIGHEPTTKQ